MPALSDAEKREVYCKLRDVAFSRSAESLNIMARRGGVGVVGALMEQNVGDFTVLVTGLATGDASFYADSRPGFIGGIAHENVRRIADDFIEATSEHIDLFEQSDEAPAPAIGEIRFYAITSRGRMACSSAAEMDKSSPLYPVFTAAHQLILELGHTAYDDD
jgi:hypothetical protein